MHTILKLALLSTILNRIQPNFAQQKDQQILFVGGPNAYNKSKMADDRHFENRLNNYILATVRPIVVKFGMMIHNDSSNPWVLRCVCTGWAIRWALPHISSVILFQFFFCISVFYYCVKIQIFIRDYMGRFFCRWIYATLVVKNTLVWTCSPTSYRCLHYITSLPASSTWYISK